jgi:hypothetical protein
MTVYDIYIFWDGPCKWQYMIYILRWSMQMTVYDIYFEMVHANDSIWYIFW